MYLFFDTEFTNFTHPALISIGIVSECGNHKFYAESSDYKPNQCSDFVKEIVIPLLTHENTLSIPELADSLASWINSFEQQLNFVADYGGDITLLEHLLSKTNKIEIRPNILKLEQAVIIATQERGIYNHSNYEKLLETIFENIEKELDSDITQRHNSLYDSKALQKTWIQALNPKPKPSP